MESLKQERKFKGSLSNGVDKINQISSGMNLDD